MFLPNISVFCLSQGHSISSLSVWIVMRREEDFWMVIGWDNDFWLMMGREDNFCLMIGREDYLPLVMEWGDNF